MRRAISFDVPSGQGQTLTETGSATAIMRVMDTHTHNEIEAAVLHRLLAHLEKRSDVQNIDLMNLAGFCRNCLSKWYAAEADARGLDVTKDEARARIYGMPYDEWKGRYQKEATPEQVDAFERVRHGGILHLRVATCGSTRTLS